MYTVRSSSGRVLRRFVMRRDAEAFVRAAGRMSSHRSRSPGDQTELMFGGSVVDVLGNVRPKGHAYPGGDWNCPFCGAAVLTPNDERYRPCTYCKEVHCQNPACHANPHYPVERARANVAKDEARKAEEQEREKNRVWRQNYAEEQRKERETTTNEIIREAEKRGACVRHALLGFPYQKAKFVKHRGPCPLGGKTSGSPWIPKTKDPIAEASVSHAGVAYKAIMYPQAVGTYGTAASLTLYFRRVNHSDRPGGEWRPISWDGMPKPVYVRLRSRLRDSMKQLRNRVAPGYRRT